jgi:hypothetical protein
MATEAAVSLAEPWAGDAPFDDVSWGVFAQMEADGLDCVFEFALMDGNLWALKVHLPVEQLIPREARRPFFHISL